MGLKCIVGITLCLIVLTYSVPVEVIYSGDGCECPSKLAYQVNIPKIPKPQKYTPYDYGYKIDVPPIQAKAKVSYTFDFSVEEPKPPRPEKQEKLNLYAKVDRITMNKQDCVEEYAPPSSSCNCAQCGVAKPVYRYVNRKVTPCKCRNPKCNCNLRRRTIVGNAQMPVVVASGPLERRSNSLRRKRDLHRIFFRPRRHDVERLPRYVKLYHKNLPEQTEGWLNMDLFSQTNPFKRKTKKVFLPHIRSKIVKRDIKGEYDLLEKDREVMDLTLPEIVQFMPETLQPNFKRGQCHFGCGKSNLKEKNEGNIQTIKSADPTIGIGMINSNSENNNDEKSINNNINNNFNKINFYKKRNVGDNNYQNLLSSYQTSVSPIPEVNAASQNDYGADVSESSLPLNPTNPNYEDVATSMLSPCEQRKVYATMRQAAELESNYNKKNLDQSYLQGNNQQLGIQYSPISPVADPNHKDAIPLKYAGDLEVRDFEIGGYNLEYPTVGAPQYPVQHISSALLDRIISDIVYRHPEFIEATSHYGGALVDPEPYQEQQTKDFIKKLFDGRLSLLFGEPENAYTHFYPERSYNRQIYNPYTQSRPITYYPAMY